MKTFSTCENVEIHISNCSGTVLRSFAKVADTFRQVKEVNGCTHKTEDLLENKILRTKYEHKQDDLDCH